MLDGCSRLLKSAPDLDADIMIAKPLTYRNLFDERGRAYTVSSLAKHHWSWQHRNLQNTCTSAKLDCTGINSKTSMSICCFIVVMGLRSAWPAIIGFTPIPFYVPLIFSLAHHLATREGIPWLDFLVQLRQSKPPRVWTEYSLVRGSDAFLEFDQC